MKKTILIMLLSIISTITFAKYNNYAFCYGPIAVILYDGGKAIMERYDNNKRVVSRVIGEFYVSEGNYPDVLKINFQGTEYRYDYIRDSSGSPMMIIDSMGREYKMCKKF